jgi:hypothetical protein
MESLEKYCFSNDTSMLIFEVLSQTCLQERTGRIIFKLFGQHPSNFPVTLRAQVSFLV